MPPSSSSVSAPFSCSPAGGSLQGVGRSGCSSLPSPLLCFAPSTVSIHRFIGTLRCSSHWSQSTPEQPCSDSLRGCSSPLLQQLRRGDRRLHHCPRLIRDTASQKPLAPFSLHPVQSSPVKPPSRPAPAFVARPVPAPSRTLILRPSAP